MNEALLTATTTESVSDIVTRVGEIVTGAVSWLGSFATAITSNPIILFFVIMAAVGLGVGLIRRLINVN